MANATIYYKKYLSCKPLDDGEPLSWAGNYIRLHIYLMPVTKFKCITNRQKVINISLNNVSATSKSMAM
jgi:hypothetical protein